MISGINSASQMASQLFSRLDTKNQGFIEKSDLSSAFSQLASKANSSSSTSSVDDVFSALDSNSDGKVTKDEFSTVLAKLQEQMDSQRMSGHHGGPHGAGGHPPPPANDAGFTKDELTSQLKSADSSDSQRNSLISKVVDNFAAADTDGDGKVSFKEAKAFDQSTEKTANSAASSSEASVMKKIMQLIHAYGESNTQSQSGLSVSV